MDFRITNLPGLRLLTKRGQTSQPSQFATRFESIAAGVATKILPTAGWLYGLRRRMATISVVVLTAWLFAHVMLGANGMVVYRTKRVEVRSLQKEIDSLQKENDQFGKQINDLKTDPRTIEKEARERLHYARPGEVVYVMPPPAPLPQTPRTNFAEK